MYTFYEVNQEVMFLFAQARVRAGECLEIMKLVGDQALVSASPDIFCEPEYKDKILVIEEGSILLNRDGATLFVFEKGDIIGADEALGYPVGKFSCEMAVVCRQYEATTLWKGLTTSAEAARLWSGFLAAKSAAISLILAESLQGQEDFQPRLRCLAPGEVLIGQGDTSSHVYSLVEGELGVTVDGVDVGRIEGDTIFGAFAAITGAPRSATVTSQGECVVFEIEREDFLKLINQRPSAAVRLVEGLVQNIASLNEKVVSLTNGAVDGPMV